MIANAAEGEGAENKIVGDERHGRIASPAGFKVEGHIGHAVLREITTKNFFNSFRRHHSFVSDPNGDRNAFGVTVDPLSGGSVGIF